MLSTSRGLAGNLFIGEIKLKIIILYLSVGRQKVKNNSRVGNGISAQAYSTFEGNKNKSQPFMLYYQNQYHGT